MIVVFETAVTHAIVYLDIEAIVAIVHDEVVTMAGGWSIQVSKNDLDRVVAAFKHGKGLQQ